MHRLLGLVALAAAVPVYAQDIEYLEPEFEDDSKLEVRARFETQWHEYNNLDFRPLDETTDQTILDSDDRNAFAFSGASLQLQYNLDARTTFRVAAAHRGLWGNDQTGNINRFGGFFWFSDLSVDWAADTGDNAVHIRVGRQFFEVGGLPVKDFMLSDVVDQIRVTVPLSGIGRVEWIPINVAGLSGSNDGANFVSFIGQSTTQTFGFRGDHMTRRTGAIFVMDELVDSLDVRAHAFYTDVGALGSGSDISYNGALGNFSDNDWVLNLGVRASYATESGITPFAEFDYSNGIDRKELVATDVSTIGAAFGGGVDLRLGEDTGFRGMVRYYQATGGQFADDGLMYNHGYVGMKAQQVGGILGDRFLGWHPTAYIGMFGVQDNPQDLSRKAGTRLVTARAGYDFGMVDIQAQYWLMQDTGLTLLDPNDLDTIDPPFGYAREEFAAQSRHGGILGHEINLTGNAQVSDHIRFRLNGGVLLPGSFYAQDIARVAGTALGGQQFAWAVNAGTRVDF